MSHLKLLKKEKNLFNEKNINNYNYICLSSDKKALGYGYYKDSISNPGATYKTQRVWINNGNSYFYEDDAWGNGCQNVLGYYYNGAWNTIRMQKAEGSYYYADIPYEVGSAHFMRMSSNVNEEDESVAEHRYLAYKDELVSLSYGVCYLCGTSSLDDFSKITTSIVYGADATLLSLVVEAYLTYGKADSNGATSSTITNLKSTWFDNKSATADDLKNTKILDYTGYSANGNSYEGLTKNASFSVNEKWNTMLSGAGVKTSNFFTKVLAWFNSDKGKVIGIIGGVAVVTIVGVTIYFVISSKKKWKD